MRGPHPQIAEIIFANVQANISLCASLLILNQEEELELVDSLYIVTLGIIFLVL